MQKVSMRIILAIIGGALIWESIRSGVSGNLEALFLLLLAGYLIYRSRFF